MSSHVHQENFYKQPNNSINTPKNSWILIFCVFLISLIIAGRLCYLGTKKAPSQNKITLPKIERGFIYDRNGYLLAGQVETYTIDLWKPEFQNFKDPDFYQKIRTIAEHLAPLILWDKEILYQKLTTKDGPRNITLIRKTNKKIRDEILSIIKLHNMKGLRVIVDQGRVYPHAKLAANLIGYVNLDNGGGDGLEYAYERILSPSGFEHIQRDHVHGDSIELTLDIPLQSLLERKILQAVKENKASSAIAIAADAKTADILAYVSIPSYDPNHYNTTKVEERLNRPAVYIYEPGSVFKLFSISSVLNTGLVTTNDVFHCPGFYKIYPNKGMPITIKCVKVHGKQTVAQIIANSCNTGTAAIMEKMNSQDFYNKLRNFGFGQKTHVHIPGETAGLLSKLKNWSLRSKATIAMGQEIGVQALQMIQAATALTNNGIMLRPRIVNRIIGSDGSVVQEYPKNMISEILSPHVANTVLSMMELGVDSGIARTMRVPGLRIGAKTGTSQTFDPLTRSYSSTNYIASSLAIFPIQDPRFIIYIVIFNPQGKSYFGANIVAPLIGELALEMIPLYGLPSESVHSLQSLKYEPPSIASESFARQAKYLPDFTRMNKQQLEKFFKSNPNLRYHYSGNGKIVTEQFPPTGTLITSQTRIRIEF